jgi:head-tail adaptor
VLELKKVKGNTLCVLQDRTSLTNSIGEQINDWFNAVEFYGVLGLQAGDSKRIYNAKIEESTHVVVCDFSPEIYAYADQDVRCIIKGKMYDVTLIDNPDELDEHLEIYLKYIGGQNG